LTIPFLLNIHDSKKGGERDDVWNDFAWRR